MKRFQIRTIAVVVLVAFASMGTLVLTDNFVPEAEANHGCIPATIECIIAILEAIEACKNGPNAECIAAAINAYNKCEHAWNDCN